ncbi:MAG: phosphoenolpyruvate--protein phosphotransferase [candidate division WOR-3 bacterium]
MIHVRERLLRGLPVSSGIAVGRAFVYRAYLPRVPEKVLSSDEVEAEVRRFEEAVSSVESELRRLHGQVLRHMGRDFAEFIDVQLALLRDEEVLSRTVAYIRKRLRNAEFAYGAVLQEFVQHGGLVEAPFFVERRLDLGDVSRRVLSQLLGEELPSLHSMGGGSIVVAHDLPPSEAALLDPSKVVGVVLEAGGKTSHTAIMAKAKEVPAVVGVEGLMRRICGGETLLVDGYRGLVVVNPTPDRLSTYKVEVLEQQRRRRSLRALSCEEPITLDGKRVDLSANIEFAFEARVAKDNGARGIGLFRTEYMYLARRRPPTEDEQYETIAEVARMMQPFPVIVRTFDLGGDKIVPGYFESNPFLGWRAIRMCLDNEDFFRTQLRAIVRASALGSVKIMFPMVATLEELRRAKLLVWRVCRELRAKKVTHVQDVEIGVMIETPSAALLADRFAQECSFLSIGSNDLTQYTLAVDRGNKRVATLFDHFHPAVLQLVDRTIQAAHRQGVWVGMCGEFASDPMGILLLLGLGIDEISVTPSLIPEAKNTIRAIHAGLAATVARQALDMGTALEVHRLLRREVHRRFPQLEAALVRPGVKGDSVGR